MNMIDPEAKDKDTVHWDTSRTYGRSGSEAPVNSISTSINLIIVVITAIIVVKRFKKDGKWSLNNGRIAFRFFTTQSNVLCALSALAICLYPEETWAYYFKIIGTAAVTVTMLTVLLFLSRVYGLIPLLKGQELFVHLITPLLALISLIGYERRGISFGAAFIGLIPVALYAPLYLYKVVVKKTWDDFYAFNRDVKWQISYAMMLAGTALICIALYFALNLPR